jgi:hypothetical protein
MGVASALNRRLDCGHEIPLLEQERPDDPPRRPPLCPVCRKMPNVTVDPWAVPPPR